MDCKNILLTFILNNKLKHKTMDNKKETEIINHPMKGERISINVTGLIVEGIINEVTEDEFCIYFHIKHTGVSWGDQILTTSLVPMRKFDEYIQGEITFLDKKEIHPEHFYGELIGSSCIAELVNSDNKIVHKVLTTSLARHWNLTVIFKNMEHNVCLDKLSELSKSNIFTFRKNIWLGDAYGKVIFVTSCEKASTAWSRFKKQYRDNDPVRIFKNGEKMIGVEAVKYFGLMRLN